MAKIKVGKIEKKKAKQSNLEVEENEQNGNGNSESEAAPSEIDGYKVMKLKSSVDSGATHHVLVKEHAVRERCPEKPITRTIFVRSVPPFVTEEALRNAFGTFGPIKNIYLHSAPCASLPAVNTSEFFTDVPPVTGFRVAYIVYEDKGSARKALLASSETPLLLFPDGRPSTSLLDKLVEQYNKRMTTDSKALKIEVDTYMELHDRLLKEKEELEKNKREEEEAEDGWVTVTRKSGIPRKESVHNKIMKKQDMRSKKTQLLNFYRFQMRDSKMTQLVKLREKFEEDKKRIAQLKESRKFKPF